MKDYKTAFIAAVDDLIAEEIEDRQDRGRAIEALTDAYIDSVGERPVPEQLDRLADYLLREELTDDHPDKMTRNEYPIMSRVQEERRRDREYSLGLAEHYDEDGRNRTKPVRRRRTAREERHVDKAARLKNRTRNAQYRKDTSPGDVVSYNVRDNGGELSEPFVNCVGIGEAWRERLGCVY